MHENFLIVKLSLKVIFYRTDMLYCFRQCCLVTQDGSGNGLVPVWCQDITLTTLYWSVWQSGRNAECRLSCSGLNMLTHWGRVTHICVGNLTIIGPDNGLSPGRRQAIIWINAGILLIGPCGTNFSEILIGIQIFSFKKMHLKMSSAKWRLFCLDLDVLNQSNNPYCTTLCFSYLCIQILGIHVAANARNPLPSRTCLH